MTHVLNISRDDPIIHLKAYGGLRVTGVDQAEVKCEIEAPQLATLVEEDGEVFVTVNSSCSLTVPVSSSLQIEKGMGSIAIANITNEINIEKAMGNLVLDGVANVFVERVGGNFAARNTTGSLHVEKVGGNLVLENVEAFTGEKIGGNCLVKDIHGRFILEKAGGGFRGQDFDGLAIIDRVGGAFIARHLKFARDLRAGGSILLKDFDSEISKFSCRAGGSIELEIAEDFEGAKLILNSGAKHFDIKINGDDLEIRDDMYEYTIGESDRKMIFSSGGRLSLKELQDPEEEIVSDLTKYFTYEETAFSEMIQDRIESATRIAEAKIRAAEIRLGRMQEHLDKVRDIHVNVDLDDIEKQVSDISFVPPVPPISKPIGKKGASDEERLMILKMLQEKKITVDEAESLFKALED